jgi:ABC-type spermidine/putrescine transport system permease subunit I
MGNINFNRLKYLIPAVPLVLFVIIFFLLPQMAMVEFSFGEALAFGKIKHVFTLQNYINFFTDPFYLKVLFKSFCLGIAVMVVTIPFGYVLAYALWQSEGKKRKFLYICILFPLFTNLVVRLYGWRIMLSSAGPISWFFQAVGITDQPVNMLFNWPAIVLGLFSESIPYFVLILFSILTLINPRYLDVAHDLGASRIKTFIKVTWPLSLPGVVAGGILTYIWAFGAYATPTILGQPKHWTLAVHAERQILLIRDWPYGSAMGIIILIFTLLIIYLQSRLFKSAQTFR